MMLRLKTRYYEQEGQRSQSRSECEVRGVEGSQLNQADVADRGGEEVRLVGSMESHLGGCCCQAEELESAFPVRGLLSENVT